MRRAWTPPERPRAVRQGCAGADGHVERSRRGHPDTPAPFARGEARAPIRRRPRRAGCAARGAASRRTAARAAGSPIAGSASGRRSRRVASSSCGSPAPKRWSRSCSVHASASAVICGNRTERPADHPPDRERHQHQDDGREDQRGEEGPRRRALIRLEIQADNDRSGPRAATHHGHGVEPRVGGRLVHVAPWAAGELVGLPLDGRRCWGPLQGMAARVHPRLGIDGALVGGLDRPDLPAADFHGIDGRGGAFGQHLIRVVMEAGTESEVEADDKRGERDDGRDHDDGGQPPPEGRASASRSPKLVADALPTVRNSAELPSSRSFRRSRATYTSRASSWTIAPCGHAAWTSSRRRKRLLGRRRAPRAGGTRLASSDRPLAGRDRVRRRVEPQVAHGRDGVAAAPPEERAEPSDKLGEGEGLGQVVVAAGAEARQPVGDGVARRQEQDRGGDARARSAWQTSRPSASGRPMSITRTSGDSRRRRPSRRLRGQRPGPRSPPRRAAPEQSGAGRRRPRRPVRVGRHRFSMPPPGALASMLAKDLAQREAAGAGVPAGRRGAPPPARPRRAPRGSPRGSPGGPAAGRRRG